MLPEAEQAPQRLERKQASALRMNFDPPLSMNSRLSRRAFLAGSLALGACGRSSRAGGGNGWTGGIVGASHQTGHLLRQAMTGPPVQAETADVIVAGGGITLIALATRGPWAGLATLVYYMIYGPFEGHVLSPLIFRRTVHVNPLITLLAILFLAELAGVIGAGIAVPVAAAGQIILREVLSARRARLRGELGA